MPARLQVHVSGSQNTLQSQPQSSRDRRMARSSCFSSTSIFFTPEARNRALRFFVGRGCRKKYSSTSVLSKSISSSEMSSTVSVLASSDSTVPFLVIYKYKEANKDVIWAESKIPHFSVAEDELSCHPERPRDCRSQRKEKQWCRNKRLFKCSGQRRWLNSTLNLSRSVTTDTAWATIV